MPLLWNNEGSDTSAVAYHEDDEAALELRSHTGAHATTNNKSNCSVQRVNNALSSMLTGYNLSFGMLGKNRQSKK
jgi:hypothetical protein